MFVILFFTSKANKKDSIVFKKSNRLTINAGGENLILGGSLQYERLLINKKYFYVSAGLGLGHSYGLFHEKILAPTFINVGVGKQKHFIELSLGVNHLIDFSPYPKTKKERADFRNNPPFESFRYTPPYIPSFYSGINYMYISKKGLQIKIGVCLNYAKLQLTYPANYILFPKLTIGYEF
jgi:hypothetical protein